jgi:hypothetical protein
MESRLNKKMKICFSYSCDTAYIPYLKKSLETLNKNAPRCFANADLINVDTGNIDSNNTTVVHTNKIFEEEHILIKNKTSEILKERFVSMPGAYANLKKVYNVYDLLFKYDYVINMDADNLVLKDVYSFFETADTDADILLKYSKKGRLEGQDLEKRKFNFRHFDCDMIDIESLDVHFREGCMVIKSTEKSKEFFKIIKDNILSKIVWYGDSYWMAYAYKQIGHTVRFKELPNTFVAYDLYNELNDSFVCSGYGKNKHSSKYAELVEAT